MQHCVSRYASGGISLAVSGKFPRLGSVTGVVNLDACLEPPLIGGGATAERRQRKCQGVEDGHPLILRHPGPASRRKD